MKRRNFILGAGTAVASGAAVLGSGAFSSVEADRDIAVEVASDADSFLRLAPCDGPNGDYVVGADDGTMALDLTGSNDQIDGDGVNAEAVTTIDNVFEIANQGTQDVCVDFEVDVPQIPSGAEVPDGFEFGPGDPAVVFYRGSDRDRFVVINRLNPDRPGAIRLPLETGEAECIGVQIRAFGFDSGDELFDDDELTIRADAGGDCQLGAADPDPGADYFSEGAYRLQALDTDPDPSEDVSGQDDITADLDLTPDGELDFDLGTEGNVNASLEAAYGAAGVDLDGIDTIAIDVDFEANGDHDQSNFYLGVDGDRDNIRRSTIRDDEIEESTVIGFDGNGETSFDGTLELDVNDITGRRAVGFGAQLSTGGKEELQAMVDRVAFLNDGDEEFSLRLNSSLAPGFTSEGEYRSVAEDAAPDPSENLEEGRDDFTAELTADGVLDFDLRVGTPEAVNAVLEKTYGATDVNVDSLDTIEVDVDFEADRDSGDLQSNFYVGIAGDRDDISRSTIRDDEVERADVIGRDGDGEAEFDGTLVLDVSELAGKRDIGIGTQISTNGEEELSATVDHVAFRREIATEFSLGLDGGSD